MGVKILIIDDNPDDLLIAKKFLEKNGFKDIVTAENGEEGVKIAESQRPDLVVTDTQMPGIDGFETCRRIREALGQDHPKIVIITGAIDAVDAVKAREVGADDYCAKTSDIAPLLEIVKTLFKE